MVDEQYGGNPWKRVDHLQCCVSDAGVLAGIFWIAQEPIVPDIKISDAVVILYPVIEIFQEHKERTFFGFLPKKIVFYAPEKNLSDRIEKD